MVLVLLLLFLVPIALYCLVLAGINRTGRPVIVSGLADFVGLLFALSGFLFVVAPQMLKVFFERAMDSIPLDLDDTTFVQSLSEVGIWWRIAGVGYYVLLLAGIGIGLGLRRNTTVIYNVYLSTFEIAFARALDRLGLAVSNDGKEFYLTSKDFAPDDERVMKMPAARPARREAALQFEYFPALCHLTLHWTMDSRGTRDDVEAELAHTLREEQQVNENPASLWLLGVGGTLIGMILVILILLMLIGLLFR